MLLVLLLVLLPLWQCARGALPAQPVLSRLRRPLHVQSQYGRRRGRHSGAIVDAHVFSASDAAAVAADVRAAEAERDAAAADGRLPQATMLPFPLATIALSADRSYARGRPAAELDDVPPHVAGLHCAGHDNDGRRERFTV